MENYDRLEILTEELIRLFNKSLELCDDLQSRGKWSKTDADMSYYFRMELCLAVTFMIGLGDSLEPLKNKLLQEFSGSPITNEEILEIIGMMKGSRLNIEVELSDAIDRFSRSSQILCEIFYELVLAACQIIAISDAHVDKPERDMLNRIRKIRK